MPTRPSSEHPRRLERRSDPTTRILGEEYGTPRQRPTHRQWIIDPIDGTANFLRGVPIWGTLIALAIDGVPVVGVVSVARARRSAGGRHRSRRLGADRRASAPGGSRVSGVRDLADASLSYNSIPGWDDAGRLDAHASRSRARCGVRAPSATCGRTCSSPRARSTSWASSTCSPTTWRRSCRSSRRPAVASPRSTGEPGPWHGSALATNGLLHEEVLRRLKAE